MLMPDSCGSCVKLAVGKQYPRACSKPRHLLPTVMMRMIPQIKPRKHLPDTVVLLAADPTTRVECAQEAVMCGVAAEGNSATGTSLVVVVAIAAAAQAIALERDSTALRTSLGVLTQTLLTRERPGALGKAMTNVVRAGMTTAICSNVTSALATRPFAKDAPNTGTRLTLVAYLTVSTVSTAAAISKRSAPARLDPNDHLLV